MLAGSYVGGTISKYQNETPKEARKAFNTGDAWNPVCCLGNKIVEFALWSTFSGILLQRIKHFRYKLVEISFFIIFDQNSVECMTSSIDYFAYFVNLNILRSSSETQELLVGTL